MTTSPLRRTTRALTLVATSLPLLLACACSDAGPGEATGHESSALSTGLVISQVYGGGGNASATYTNDFVELFNLGSTPASLSGLSVQYAGSSGDFTTANVVVLPAVTVQPGHYYLVGLGSGGTGGVALPTPDFSDTGVNVAVAAGKVALVQGTTALACDAGACVLTGVVDLVGYGAATTQFEGSGPAAAPTGSGAAANGPSVQRRLAGCAETDDNAADFESPVLTANARNATSPANVCAALDAGPGDAGDAGTSKDASADADGGAGSSDAGGDAVSDAGAGDAVSDTGAGDAVSDAATDAGGDAAVGNTQGLVVSQIYGGGGNSGAPYSADFVELFNRGSAAVSLSGLSLQYASAAANFDAAGVVPLPAATIPPGHYFLVALASGATGAALPTADFTDASLNASASSGKIVLAFGTTALACGGDAGVCASSQWVDLVGYGAGASAFEGSGPATAPSGNTTAVLRRGAGCVDTNDNAADFESPTLPADPRNSATPFNDCTVVPSDAGPEDAGAEDTGSKDAGSQDAGPKDAGGGGADAAVPEAGGADTGAPDATADDASAPADSGEAADAAKKADSGAFGFDDSNPQKGCSCRTVGSESSSPTPAGALVLGGAALVLARTRRRRTDRPGNPS